MADQPVPPTEDEPFDDADWDGEVEDEDEDEAGGEDEDEDEADDPPAGTHGNGATFEAGPTPDFSTIGADPAFVDLGEMGPDIARLAAMPEAIYERARKDEAKKLKLRVSVLDKLVKQARPRDAEDTSKAGKAIVLTTAEPWAEPVDGAQLISDLITQLARFIRTTPASLLALALWTLHTYCWSAWWVSPKLLVIAATKRCGKTRTFEVLQRMVARPILASDSTSSVIFRVIELHAKAPPTLLLDEADELTTKDDDMRRLINASHTKAAATILRNVPDGDGGWEPRQFSTWAPIALSGIGQQADTIRDRAITINLRRKAVEEIISPLYQSIDYGFYELAQKCARWETITSRRWPTPRHPSRQVCTTARRTTGRRWSPSPRPRADRGPPRPIPPRGSFRAQPRKPTSKSWQCS